MKENRVAADMVADAIINMSANIGMCDESTAKGFKTSKKKDILKSNDDQSFAEFTQEIIIRQNRKDGKI